MSMDTFYLVSAALFAFEVLVMSALNVILAIGICSMIKESINALRCKKWGDMAITAFLGVLLTIIFAAFLLLTALGLEVVGDAIYNLTQEK
jgi:hypothetical protein